MPNSFGIALRPTLRANRSREKPIRKRAAGAKKKKNTFAPQARKKIGVFTILGALRRLYDTWLHLSRGFWARLARLI